MRGLARQVLLTVLLAGMMAFSAAAKGPTDSLDIWYAKFDTTGRLCWQGQFGSFQDQLAIAVAQSNTGSWLIFSDRLDFGEPPFRLSTPCLTVLSEDGKVLLQTSLAVAHDMDTVQARWEVAAAIPLADGTVLLTGPARTREHYLSHFDWARGAWWWMARVTDTGATLWRRDYPPEIISDSVSSVYLSTIKPTPDGGYLLAGDCLYKPRTQNADSVRRPWLLKTDPDGLPEWGRLLEGSDRIGVAGVAPASDGGYWLCGNSEDPFLDEASYGGLYSHGWLAKVDSLGRREWDRAYFPGPSLTVFEQVQEVEPNRLLVESSTSAHQGPRKPYRHWLRFHEVNREGDLIAEDTLDVYEHHKGWWDYDHTLIEAGAWLASGVVKETDSLYTGFIRYCPRSGAGWFGSWFTHDGPGTLQLARGRDGYLLTGYTYSRDFELRQQDLPKPCDRGRSEP